MSRGPKLGSVRVGSLASKLSNLAVGEWLCLSDHEPGDKPTRLERHVQTLIFRSPAFEGWSLATERVLIVGQNMQTDRALRITRRA